MIVQPLRSLMRDIRFGARTLVTSPGFTLVALLCLSLGIGANVTIFSAVYGIVLRQLPFPDSDAILEIRSRKVDSAVRTSRFLPIPRAQDLIADAKSIGPVGSFIPATFTLTNVQQPEQVSGLFVTSGWFAALGTRAELGRTLNDSDEQAGQERVCVLSHALWVRTFGGSREVIGSSITIAPQELNVLQAGAPPGESYLVVGVMPERAMFPADGEIWIPLRWERHVTTMGLDPRRAATVGVLARVRNGQSLRSVNAELRVISSRLADQYPATDRGWEFQPIRLRDSISERYSRLLDFLLATVSLVLLLACLSVSGLVVARGLSRRHEVAVRQALGARRGHLLQQFLCEGALLSLVGGLLGLALAYWLIHVFRQFAPASIPRVQEIAIHPAVLSYLLVAITLCTVVVGLFPALRLSDPQPASALRALRDRPLSATSTAGFRWRGLLIGCQIALFVPLAFGAILMLRSVERLLAVDLGYRPGNVLAANIRMSSTSCRRFATCATALDDIIGRLASVPGVSRVAFTATRPFTLPLTMSITLHDAPGGDSGRTRQAAFHIVTPEYFRVLGLHVKSGRTFHSSDSSTAPAVAVVNTAMATQLLGGKPVGRLFDMPGRPKIEVVGEVTDTRDLAISKLQVPTFYVPLTQGRLLSRTVVLIETDNTSLVAPQIAAAVHAVDANAPVETIETLEQIIDRQVSAPRFQAVLLMTFASLGLVLALLGIYGLISYSTAERFHEFGVRLALGAQRRDIVRLVASEGIITVGWGLTFGVAAAIVMGNVLRSQLYEVAPFNPLALSAACLLVAVSAGAAFCLPALRATQIDPVQALRAD